MRLRFAWCLGCVVACTGTTASAPPPAPPAGPAVSAAPGARSRTVWDLRPSQAYDAICFANLLTGDPFYASADYAADVARFAPRLGDAERAALAHLESSMKTKRNEIISAKLSLVFSVANVETLDDLVAIVGDDARWGAMRAAFLETSYGEKEDFADLEEVRPDLVTVFRFLARAGFADDWKAHALPRVRAAIDRYAAEAPKYDVVGLDEEVLGRRLDVPSLTAYVLAYVRPHAVRITGWRFLTDASWPMKITVKTALHELLHPPFARTGELDARLAALEADPYFVRLLREHDPSFGYNTGDGLLEEDCVEAVDVYNAHRLGLLEDPVAYFADHDDGLHVVAFLLYRALERSDARTRPPYPQFVLELLQKGELTPLEAAFARDSAHYAPRCLGR